MSAGPVVHPGPPGAVPTARDVRRYTTRAGNARGGASFGELLGDVYYAVVLTAIAVGMALGVAGALRTGLPPVTAAPVAGLSLPALVVAVVVALGGALVQLAGRLGPVGVGGAEAAWWLPLPVDRRGLLRPAARRPPVLAALVGGVVVGVLDAGLASASRDRLLRTVPAAALAAAALVLAAALAQTAGASRRLIARTGEVVVAAVPVAALVAALAGARVAAVPTPPWAAVGALGALVVVLALVVDGRLDRVPGRALRESGSLTTQAVGALVSLDSRELGRVLTEGAARPRRRRWVPFATVRGPASALVTADLVVLRRSPRHLVQLAVSACVPFLVTLVPGLAGPAAVLLALFGAGLVATSATAEGARRAEMVPVLDRLLPLPATTVRRLRMVVPAVAMLPWTLVAFAAVGRWTGEPVGWLALAVAATPVWAAAAVRGAYRPSPDWGAPLVSTPAGAVPTGVAAVVARGPDVVVLGLLPVAVTLLVGEVHTLALTAQATAAVVAVAVASSTDTRTLLERLSDAAEPAGGGSGPAGSPGAAPGGPALTGRVR
ncbi:DUF6297 family protein [Cellulomonas marina]|uniref:ABC-2 type transport system permease protein n=1 Tax=Cellulomonas marina TaxID=988821 RepID=A0A1I0YPW8_9CELL|nr:DUF6297 family protein [Cellulomonas marina]GIG27603.1 hypothetical protein Cma02nite_02030 [Cellulomonas marina]SFB14997.1 hypothetical protein SAMN05421867_10871 [Cellulomonas marina]